MFVKHFGKFFGLKTAERPITRNDTNASDGKGKAKNTEPTLLPSSTPSNNHFPMDALSPRAYQAATAIQRIIQAPDALAAQAVLGAMSLSVASTAKVQSLVSNASHPVALYLMTIAESGERKSAVDSQAMGGINGLIDEMIQDHSAKMADYLDQVRQLKRGEEKPKKPDLPLFLSNEPTIEGMLDMIAGGPGFTGLFTDEAGVFFGGYSMSSDQRMKSAGVLSKLWDHVTIFRPRASKDAVSIVPACPTTVNLMIQPVVLENSYNDDFLVGQGLLARMLPAWPPSNIGNRPFRDATRPDLDAVTDFQARTRLLLEEALVDHREMRILNLDAQCKKSIRAFHDDIEKKMLPGGEYDDIRGFAAKAAEHALRIAGVMTLFEDQTATDIDEVCLHGAEELVRFYLNEFRHIRSAAKSDVFMDQAELLRKWLLMRVGAGKPFSRELMQQKGPASIRRNETLNKVLKTLVEYGWVHRLPAGTKVDGKVRMEAYRVHHKADTIAPLDR